MSELTDKEVVEQLLEAGAVTLDQLLTPGFTESLGLGILTVTAEATFDNEEDRIINERVNEWYGPDSGRLEVVSAFAKATDGIIETMVVVELPVDTSSGVDAVRTKALIFGDRVTYPSSQASGEEQGGESQPEG